MKQSGPTEALPEKVGYTKYYEYDGLLRAYANRAMLLAAIFGLIAITSLGFAIYVRLQPPTVVRIDSSGEASAINLGPQGKEGLSKMSFHVAAAAETEPTELEARALARRFLSSYLNYSPAVVDRNFAEALNLMTANLKTYTLNKLREAEIVQKIKDGNMVSTFKLRDMEPIKGAPYTLMAFGVREVHQTRDGVESTDRIVSRHKLRLAVTRRSEYNPSGLLVAEYWEQQIVGDRNSSPLQESLFSK